MFINETQESNACQSIACSSTESNDSTIPDSRPWDSSDPYFSADVRELIHFVSKCYVRQIITIIGIAGNTICCIVFFRQGLSDRVTLLLFWLAVADLSHLLAHTYGIGTCYFSDQVHVSNRNTVYNATFLHVVIWFGITAGALMAIMSVNRCLSIVRPIKARRLLSYSPMAAAIVLAYLIPFGQSLVLFLASNVKWKTDPSTNRSIAYIAETAWFPVDSQLRAQLSYYFPVIVKPIFLVTVTVCSIITIICLRKAAGNRLQMTGSVRERGDTGENKITRMLLFLCVLYDVVLCLELSVSLTHLLFPEFYVYRKYHNRFIIVYQTLVYPSACVNSAVNVFAYLLLSSRFRSKFKELFHCFCRNP